ncbi:hypothetical protein AGMMS49521_2780 [Campylobacterota bacterium]|nr:hypothetical protein AGMMS49521_2780 [Campylobacterota bacterium]
MKQSMNGTERAIRIVAGLAVIVGALYANYAIFAIVGLAILATGGFGYSPIRKLFGSKKGCKSGCGCGT